MALATGRRRRPKNQGDHGRCRANYRCCIPALAGFVSPHSVGPGKLAANLRRPGPEGKEEFKVARAAVCACIPYPWPGVRDSRTSISVGLPIGTLLNLSFNQPRLIG